MADQTQDTEGKRITKADLIAGHDLLQEVFSQSQHGLRFEGSTLRTGLTEPKK